MSSRLPQSKRNALIADFNAGIQDKEYEVIPSKNQKGRYTIRRRKENIEGEPAEEQPPQEPSVVVESDDSEEEPLKDIPEEPKILNTNFDENMFNPYMYIQEYQMALNRMMVEQMKSLRQTNKYLMKKQKKYKERQQQIRNIFQEVVKTPDSTEEPEEPSYTEPIEEEHEETTTQDYFDNTYQNTEPTRDIELEKPLYPEPEPVQYQNDYEEQLDDMAQNYTFGSRRDRIKAFI